LFEVGDGFGGWDGRSGIGEELSGLVFVDFHGGLGVLSRRGFVLALVGVVASDTWRSRAAF
jgi:hypothetical protein